MRLSEASLLRDHYKQKIMDECGSSIMREGSKSFLVFPRSLFPPGSAPRSKPAVTVLQTFRARKPQPKPRAAFRLDRRISIWQLTELAHGRTLNLPIQLSAKSIERKFNPPMSSLLYLFRDDQGQDIAEYAVMLAVILVLVVGTIRLVGSNANNVFSSVASSVQ